MSEIMFSACLTVPEEKSRVGVILIQEWWGVDDHIKSLTSTFAEQGFPCLAPDLYHEKIALEPDDAKKLAMNLEITSAVKEISYSINLLKNYCTKIVLCGFCMGGTVALKTAEEQSVDGVLAFYPGNYDPSVDEVQKYNSPVHIFFGNYDQAYDADKLDNIVNKFRQKDKDIFTHIFSGVDHAYMNNTRQRYNEEASQESWNITWQFLNSI